MSLPDGTRVTIPALIGAVQDADRLLILMNLETTALGGAGAAPGGGLVDPGAFAALLEQAYEVQSQALD